MSPEQKVFDGEAEADATQEGPDPGDGFPFDPDAEEKATEPKAEAKAEPAADPEPETESSGNTRDYVIFKAIDKTTFEMISVVNFSNGDGAIKALGEDKLEDATYYAVPSRNWNAVPVKVEKTTTITLG